MSKLKHNGEPSSYQVLDPCLLGRPVHLLHVFTAQLQDDFSQAFKFGLNRRYWSSFQVEDVAMARADGAPDAERWLAYAAEAGVIGFSIERALLLNVLNHRYGHGNAVLTSGASIRVTATEERLAMTLGQQLAATLAARIDLQRTCAPGAQAGALALHKLPMLPAANGMAPAQGVWTIDVTVRDELTGLQGRLRFSLDHALMSEMLRGLVSARKPAKVQRGPDLTTHLQLKLTGRLLSQQLALGDLLDIRVGDVIPVRLGKTEVLLEESRMFVATVTEHKGKLCLTSFEDIQ